MYRESRGSLDVENSEIKTNRLKESLFSMWELLDSPGVSRAHVRSNTLFRRARLYAQLEEGDAAQRSIVRKDSHEYHLRTLVHCRDGHTGHFRILDGRDGGGPAIRLSPSGQYHMALCGFAARVSALPGSPTSRSRRSYPAVTSATDVVHMIHRSVDILEGHTESPTFTKPQALRWLLH